MNTQTLFDLGTAPAPTPVDRRHRLMREALRHAGEVFRAAYEPFILRHLAQHGPASAEAIRLAYEEAGLPSPPSKRASGAIFQRLKSEGRIRVAGQERSRLYANKLDVYELVQ